MEKILHAEPPLPSDVNPHVPRALDGIVLGMLAGHPDDRLPGARILLRDLQRLEEELGLGPGATADTDEPTATLPPAGPETPGADQWRDRDVLRPRRDQKEPVAPEPPDPNRFSRPRQCMSATRPAFARFTGCRRVPISQSKT